MPLGASPTSVNGTFSVCMNASVLMFVMDSQSPFADATPPIPPPPSTSAIKASSEAPHRALWRWWVALVIVGAFPFAAALSSSVRNNRNSGGAATLPSSVEGLLLAGALQLAVILFFFGVSWLFSRATKAELWMNWRGGAAPIWQGALYSIGLRFLPLLPFFAIMVVLAILGYKPEAAAQWLNANRPQTEGIGDSVRAGSALYKALMLSFFSFVVAGFGEELWRVATMRGLLEIAPRAFSPLVKNSIAVLVSALVFGIGHLYQGVVGVGVTAFIGIALGAITLYHRSIWPAVIAHGCFDAASFLMVMLGADKLAEQAQKALWW